jgi:hypothetical protein
MRTAPIPVAVLLLLSLAVSAQVATPQAPAPQGAPAPQQPPPTAPTPPVVPPAVPPGVPAPVVPPPPLGARTFTAKTGMIFQSVRPDRVTDFETVIGYLQAAIEKSTDPAVRAQGQGWRMFKATEPGPNGTITYVFVMDPAVPGADYGFGRILSEAYPDRIQEIWKLYMGSLGPGAQLLNLTPVQGSPPAPAAAPAPTTTAPGARPAPPAGGGTQPAGRGTTPQ